jgi:DNA-binding NarL/FixJ family response regulator
MSIRVVIADDHAILRDALKVFLEKHDFIVVGMPRMERTRRAS